MNLLLNALTKAKGTTIIDATHELESLHGGTLGDVYRVSGVAFSASGEAFPYQLIQKQQKRWERPGDPLSWRREYDLAVSDFGSVFSGTFRAPEFYLAELCEDHIEIWMEAVGGCSGADCSLEMLGRVAEALGHFQGRINRRPEALRHLTCLSDSGFLSRESEQWHQQAFEYDFLCSDASTVPDHVRQMIRNNTWDNGKSVEHNYLRSSECDLPHHLKQMLIDTDDRREQIFREISRLPQVFCHRDLWVENIFVDDDTIILIDWDGAGYGYLGEDIVSLIVDETPTGRLLDYYQTLVTSYRGAIAQYIDLPPVEDSFMCEMILLKFGYRFLQPYLFSTAPEVKREAALRLHKIYEMRDIKFS